VITGRHGTACTALPRAQGLPVLFILSTWRRVSATRMSMIIGALGIGVGRP
jgi:hypothetical protein